MKQQAFNPNQSKPNLERLIEQFVNQQITISKQNEEQLKQLASKIDQIATHNRILETQIAQQASSSNTKPLGKLPSQLEFTQKETCQAITLRSGKEVKESFSKKKIVIDDDEVGIEEEEISGKKDDECTTKSKKGDAIPPKEDELKLDFKTLPFPQRYIRYNLDK